MICPYCAEDVPAGSQQHQGCKRASDKPFPPLYLEYHEDAGRTEPIVVSVIGFPGHGKTVFLCALFDYLDDPLPYIWRNNFHNLVLDQDSLTQLNNNRGMLRKGELPPPTERDFPRPGIFRLKHMPRSARDNGLPPLEDTTVLIYDPPGEAFRTEDKIVNFAGFVKRSNCVLFLIDLAELGTSIAHGMTQLLNTYVLAMPRMKIRQQSQHLIVVYTKSDEMKVSVPEFAGLLEREPWLKDYLEEQRPATLADPHTHFEQLEKVSGLLAKFTYDDLKAANFVGVADDWFASVSYTAVSSLGSAPELQEIQGEDDDEAPREDADAPLDLDEGNGGMVQRLTSEMSPRGMADPLLYVLAKSLRRKPLTVSPVSTLDRRPEGLLAKLPPWGVPALIGGVGLFAVGAGLLVLIILLILFA